MRPNYIPFYVIHTWISLYLAVDEKTSVPIKLIIWLWLILCMFLFYTVYFIYYYIYMFHFKYTFFLFYEGVFHTVPHGKNDVLRAILNSIQYCLSLYVFFGRPGAINRPHWTWWSKPVYPSTVGLCDVRSYSMSAYYNSGTKSCNPSQLFLYKRAQILFKTLLRHQLMGSFIETWLT